jgi:nucleoside-triphosphatase THEP1
VEGTAEWILATDQYKRWYETGEIGDLWIRGIPGSGKSVAASSLIQRLQRKGDAPVLFFFFRHIILSNRSPQSLMRDCLYQLLDHSPSLQSNLKNVMAGHQNVDGVPVDELWRCFSSALSGMDKAYCVIDALDEMELGQEKFLANLLDLGRRNPTSVKLALTSRQLPYLEVHLKESCLVDLRLDRRNIDRDIATYILHRLEHSQVDLTNQEALDLKEAICERGKGLFLYARLMMDQCLQDPKHFTSQLDMLPDGLGSMVSISLSRGASYFSTATDSLSSTQASSTSMRLDLEQQKNFRN